MKNKYAFWKYDLFPFVLCAPAMGLPNSDGRVFVPNYSGYIKPFALTSVEKGLEIKMKLDALRHKRQIAIAKIEKELKQELDEIMKKIK